MTGENNRGNNVGSHRQGQLLAHSTTAPEPVAFCTSSTEDIAPWEARAPDLEVNSLTLWPAELRKLMCSGQQHVKLDICPMATRVATGVQGLVPDQGWDSQNHRLCTSPWH